MNGLHGWQLLCREYLRLGIYCPQIVDSAGGRAAETAVFDGEQYVVYAEQMKKHKAFDELDPRPDFEPVKRAIVAYIGKIAACGTVLLPFPCAFSVYTPFDSTDTVDENYRNAESFCRTVHERFPEYAQYADKIWRRFVQKRQEFEPAHRCLPRASFQSDLNRSNILVDGGGGFAGFIGFNLSGTETVLCYIITGEVCGYRPGEADLPRLTDADFLRKCDDYLYGNLKIIAENYTVSRFERENLCLCYNTVYPFSCRSVNYLLSIAVKEHMSEYVKPILDWTYYQLSRGDIRLD